MTQVLRKVMRIFLILFLLWLTGFGLYFASIPTRVNDDQTHTGAIVVLTGGRERLKTGFKLFCGQRADEIFISGVNTEETLKSLLKSIDRHAVQCPSDVESFIGSIHLGYTAKNTKENAEETAAWVKDHNITSIRLVTAAYHMPRSLMELKHLLPKVTIIPHPVFPYGQDKMRWWLHEGAIHLILSEYHKLILGSLRTLLPS